MYFIHLLIFPYFYRFLSPISSSLKWYRKLLCAEGSVGPPGATIMRTSCLEQPDKLKLPTALLLHVLSSGIRAAEPVGNTNPWAWPTLTESRGAVKQHLLVICMHANNWEQQFRPQFLSLGWTLASLGDLAKNSGSLQDESVLGISSHPAWWL